MNPTTTLLTPRGLPAGVSHGKNIAGDSRANLNYPPSKINSLLYDRPQTSGAYIR